jgi:hypothetical protein
VEALERLQRCNHPSVGMRSDTRGHSVVLFCRLEDDPVSGPGLRRRQADRRTSSATGRSLQRIRFVWEGRVASCGMDFPRILAC